MSKRTDRQRIDWLEKKGLGGALISDDNGHWTMVFDGVQTLPIGKKPADIQAAFWIEKKQWQNDVREAIDKAMDEEA